MQIFILNFWRTRVDNVIKTLGLENFDKTNILQERKIQDFFDDELYKLSKEVEFINNNGGGAIIIAFNYPLLEEKDRNFATIFFKTAIKLEENLYYYPKPNHYMEIDDFALFALKNKLTPENLKVESLYRKNLIQRDLRGKLHGILRREKHIEEKYINKKFFYESRKLFNLSWQWQEYRVAKEQLEYDLIERMQEWYPYPLGFNISIHNVCNLTCVMCPFFSEEFKVNHQTDFFKTKTFLEDKFVYEAIDYCAEASVSNPQLTVGFTAAGEATLDQRLPDFIHYARNKGIPWTYIVTNGTLLHKIGKELLDSGLNRMTISIDGATPETYRKIRGADLNKVEKGVRECVEYARELNAKGHKIEFDLNCVLTDTFCEAQEKELYLSKWEDCRDIIVRIFFTRLVIYDKQGNDINKDKTFSQRDMVCSFPWSNYAIDCYGNVTVCCTMDASSMYQPISIGNVKELGVRGVWNSEMAKKLRKEQLQQQFKRFSLCAGCAEKFKSCFDEDNCVTTKHNLDIK
ncbi:radical SAM/SPASM domain-containing protein [Helicobacter canadensis]|uniref:radical SAM/SPASM domain-containing protein n=1 Tax=Helicobacter canadensis TaxID=123841 RepID=UPI000E0532E4|nr:radical SAM protein [Helicobacter canadensis]STO99401.1 molybdopterin cofactor synthesis protein A [Helicobacter canadensis]